MSSSSLPTPLPQPAEVVAFWRDAGPQQWFSKNAAFDAEFRRRFESAHIAAATRELDDWLGDSTGALALMVLLDQFPRNAYRGTAHMFATDPLARYCAEYAIGVGHDLAVDAQLRQFFYLPFEHAEDLEAQERGVALMEALAATRCAGRSCIATSSSVSVVSPPQCGARPPDHACRAGVPGWGRFFGLTNRVPFILVSLCVNERQFENIHTFQQNAW